MYTEPEPSDTHWAQAIKADTRKAKRHDSIVDRWKFYAGFSVFGAVFGYDDPALGEAVCDLLVLFSIILLLQDWRWRREDALEMKYTLEREKAEKSKI